MKVPSDLLTIDNHQNNNVINGIQLRNLSVLNLNTTSYTVHFLLEDKSGLDQY